MKNGTLSSRPRLQPSMRRPAWAKVAGLLLGYFFAGRHLTKLSRTDQTLAHDEPTDAEERREDAGSGAWNVEDPEGSVQGHRARGHPHGLSPHGLRMRL